MKDLEFRGMMGIVLAFCVGCSNDPVTQANPAPKQSRPVAVARKEQPAPAPPSGILPKFTEVATDWGIDFERYDDIRGQHRLLEANGGGVALFDFDHDLRPDVFFTNGCRLPIQDRELEHSNQLYRNGPDGRFSRVTQPAGLVQSGYFQGCTTGDFNNDGFDDLYVAAFGNNSLYVNQGDGTFTNVTLETGTEVGLWSSSPAFADLNGDGNLDLFVVTYVEAHDNPPKLCPEPASADGYVQCSPTMFPACDDVLFINDGQGGFINSTKESGVAGVDGKGLGIGIFDANQDGRPDVFIANDGTPNFLYLNEGNIRHESGTSLLPRFRNAAFDQGVAVNSQGRAQAGMGVAVTDVDGDGHLDIYITNFYGETNSLFRYAGLAGFEDATNTSGLGPPSRPLLGFGTAFVDAENDGWPDLFVTNGHIDDLTSYTDVPYQMAPLLCRSEQGRNYRDVTQWAGPYFQSKWLGRGLATADLDGDGDEDLVISHQRSRSAILRNDTSTPYRSVRLSLVGTGSVTSRDALNARVKLNGVPCPPLREVIGGGSFQSASSREIHLGLGESPSLPSLQIRWPDGVTSDFTDVRPGRYIVIQGGRMLPLPKD